MHRCGEGRVEQMTGGSFVFVLLSFSGILLAIRCLLSIDFLKRCNEIDK